MASASMVISTRSPTTIPPWSNCAFQLTPKSCRFILFVAVKPARVLGLLSTRLSRPEPPGVDLDLNRGVLRTGGIEMEPSMDVLEVPPDIGNHHMAHTEFGSGVPRFEEPSCQGSPLSLP